uniref:Band 7 domain-containing protein n=1 Tax=Cyanoptyche gloeocystis TaxID=77922 RepID=A0A7S2NP90_9EUKA
MLVGVVVAIIVCYLFCGPILVREGQVVLVERYGVYDRTLTPGLHFVFGCCGIPERTKSVRWTCAEEDHAGQISQKIFHGDRIPFKTETIFDPAPFKCQTADKIRVRPNVVVYFKIVDVRRCCYAITDLYQGLEQVVAATLLQCISEKTLDELLKNQNLVMNELRTRLQEIEIEWGLQVSKVHIQELNIPNNILEATEKLMSAEKEAEAKQKSQKVQREVEVYQQETSLKLNAVRLETEHATVIASAKAAAEKSKIEAEAELASAEIQMRRLLREAEIKDQIKRLESGADCHAVRSFIDASSESPDLVVAKIYAEGWKSLASSSSTKTLVVPYETTKFIGAMQMMPTMLVKE